ncbi:hypothetical protein LINPERPRIM_LOCUS13613 [Linum perenne]
MASEDTAAGSSSSSKISSADGVVCHHKREAILKTAGTPSNFGRRFFRCPYWKEKNRDCGFFKWADDRARVAQAANEENLTNRNDELAAKLNDFEMALLEATDMVRSLRSILEQGGVLHDANIRFQLSRVVEKLEALDSRISFLLIVMFCFIAVLVVVIVPNQVM